MIVPVLDAGDTAGKKIEISQCSSAFIPIREPDTKEFPIHITFLKYQFLKVFIEFVTILLLSYVLVLWL